MQVYKLSSATVIYAFIVFCAVFQSGFAKELLQLTQENFDNVVNGRNFVFVIFYASWDEHSINAVRSLQQALDKLDEKGDDLILGKVNAYDEVKLATRFWIDRWPMFKFFLKGSVTPETYVRLSYYYEELYFIKKLAE